MLAGVAVSRVFGGRPREHCAHALLATAADLDIAAARLRGRRIDYAYRRSHSIGAALAAGAAIGGARWLRGGLFVPLALRGSAAYASHLLLDYFGKEADSGLPLLWPLSKRRFVTDHQLFETIVSSREHFVRGLLTLRNLKRVGREVAMIAPVVIASGLLGGRDLTSGL
jgi:hypothetical protein